MFIQDEFCPVDGQPCMPNSLYCSERCRILDAHSGKCSEQHTHTSACQAEWLYPSQMAVDQSRRTSRTPSLVYDESDCESELELEPIPDTLSYMASVAPSDKATENYFLWLREMSSRSGSGY